MPSLAPVALIAALSLGIPGVAWGKHRHGPGCGHRAFHDRQEADHYWFHQHPHTRWKHQRFHNDQKKWKHKYYHKGYYDPSYGRSARLKHDLGRVERRKKAKTERVLL